MTITKFMVFTNLIFMSCLFTAVRAWIWQKKCSGHEIFCNYVLQTINFLRSQTIQEEVEYGLGIGT